MNHDFDKGKKIDSEALGQRQSFAFAVLMQYFIFRIRGITQPPLKEGVRSALSKAYLR